LPDGVQGQLHDGLGEGFVGVVDVWGGGRAKGHRASFPDLPGQAHNILLDGRLTEEVSGPGQFIVEGWAARVHGRQQCLYVEGGVQVVLSEAAAQVEALECKCTVGALKKKVVQGFRPVVAGWAGGVGGIPPSP